VTDTEWYVFVLLIVVVFAFVAIGVIRGRRRGNIARRLHRSPPDDLPRGDA
jgi:hypothetical protein